MDMGEPLLVFILQGDKPMVIHPFDDPRSFRDTEGVAVSGRVGVGEGTRNAESIRAELYQAMERGSRRYHLDKGFYLRLALSVAAFVVIYLFFSIMIRDPVPLIDELVLGTLAAAAVYFASERKALSSRTQVLTALRLRKAIDSSYVSESRVVDLVEAWRDEALALGPAAFYKRRDDELELSKEETSEAEALCEMLSRRYKSKPIVAELYESTSKEGVPGSLLDKVARKLGTPEYALALAYLRLLPYLSKAKR